MKLSALGRALTTLLCFVLLLGSACRSAPAPAPAPVVPSCAGDHAVNIPVQGDGRAECQTFCQQFTDCPGERKCGNHPGPGGKPTVVNGTMTVCPCLCLAPNS
jgi:hypothetical protein